MSGAVSATTLGIVGGIDAAGSLASAAIGSNAASKAAGIQSAAAQQASQLAEAAGDKALGIQQEANTASQAQLAPYTAAGGAALNALEYGEGVGGTANGSGIGQGSLLTPYQSFTAPTGIDEQNDPGYQARLALGTEALQKSAAAKGSVLTGGTAKALDSYGQDYASNEYSNVYNRALNTYNTNSSNYYTGQNNAFTRLANLTNTGQTAATSAATLGQNAANSEAGTLLTTSGQQGQDLTNGASATASGIVGSANAWSGGLNGIANNTNNLLLLNQLGNSGYGNPWSNQTLQNNPIPHAPISMANG